MVKDEHDHKLATVLIENLHAIIPTAGTIAVDKSLEGISMKSLAQLYLEMPMHVSLSCLHQFFQLQAMTWIPVMKSWDTMKVVRLIEALQDLHAKSSSFEYVGVVSQQMTKKLFT